MDCPDGTWIAAFVGGGVPADELLRFETHLDGCENCLERVAEVATQAAASYSRSSEESLYRDSLWVHLVSAFACVSDRWRRAVASDRPRRERFGPYRILCEIGRGAMGVVYSAVDERSSEPAAVKTVTAPTARSLSALRHEIAFLRRAQHPSIVRIYDDGVINGDPWYAMELLEGGTLGDLQRSVWPPPSSPRSQSASAAPTDDVATPRREAAGGHLDELVTLFSRLCAPLAFVHRAGIVHCDLKPSNVLVRSDRSPVLVDFGLLSRADGALGRETLEVGGFRGTLPYLAPELIRGRIPDARADIYAVGCMLYETVTGRPPFLGPTARDVLRGHLYADAVPPSRLVSGLPAAFDGLVLSLLAKSPDKRVGSAEILERLLESVLPASSRPPSSPPTPYLFRPRIVGRGGDVDRIEALSRDARDGRGHLVLVSGISGIGKTFLASEIARQCARESFEVVTGECAPFAPAEDAAQQRSGAAFGPFRNLLQRAADICRTGEPAVTAELFGGAGALRVLARYEPALAHLLGETKDEEVGALPPSAERERALESMRELLGRFAAKSPLLLILDDLQWADDLSFALLASVSAEFLREHAILILGLYRAEDAAEVGAHLQADHFDKIELKRLDDEALTAMVGDMLSRPAPPELMGALTRHSQGNPFFVAEYLRAAVSEGLLAHAADGWRWTERAAAGSLGEADSAFGLPLPGSLRDLLSHRLQRLSPGARAAAEVASVLGREFRSSMLGAVGETPEASVLRWIDEMVERQLVERVRGTELRFAHDKIRELAYARLSAPRRSTLHFRAAEAFEVAGDAGGARNFAQIAYHFRNGGAPARAIDYFEQAAEHAMQRSANQDAVRFFEEAIAARADDKSALEPTRHARWTRRIGDAYQGLGELAKGKARLLEALDRLGHPMPESPREMGRGVVAKLAKQLWHRVVPLRWVEADAGDRVALLEQARVYDRLTQIYYYLGDYDSLFFANLATLDLAERLPPSPTRAVGYTNVGATAGILALPRIANLYFDLAESALKEAYDPEVESYLRVLWGHYLTGHGEWSRALAAGERVLQLAERLLFGRRWEEGAGLRCNLAWGRDFAECMRWGDRMLESAVRRKDAHTTAWGLLRRAEIHAARGDLAQVEQSLEKAEALAQSLGAPERVRAFAIRAHLRLGQGRVDDALTLAAKAAEAIDGMKAIDLLCVEACARVAEVRLAAWAQAPLTKGSARAEEARASCKALGRAARTFPVVVPRYALHEGTRLWLSGRERAAAVQWERGRVASAELDLPYDEARLARRLERHGPPADVARHGARARELFARLGVHPLPHER